MNTEFERIHKISEDAIGARHDGDEESSEYLLWLYQEEVDKLSPANLIAFAQWNIDRLKEAENG